MTVLRRLRILVSIFWVAASAWLIASEWSGESVSSREHPLAYQPPLSWGDQHPECRDRFGLWSDSARMTPEQFSEYRDRGTREAVKYVLLQQGILQPARTPEEVTRDNWADDVHEKIASSEQDQWMPLAKAEALKQQRIGLISVALTRSTYN
jgi:hypothetical protein